MYTQNCDAIQLGGFFLLKTFVCELYLHMIYIPLSMSTGPGIYCGNIDVTGNAGEDSVTIDTNLIEYPSCLLYYHHK